MLSLNLHHVVDAVEVPRVDAAGGMDASDVPAAAQGLDHKDYECSVRVATA